MPLVSQICAHTDCFLREREWDVPAQTGDYVKYCKGCKWTLCFKHWRISRRNQMSKGDTRETALDDFSLCDDCEKKKNKN